MAGPFFSLQTWMCMYKRSWSRGSPALYLWSSGAWGPDEILNTELWYTEAAEGLSWLRE